MRPRRVFDERGRYLGGVAGTQSIGASLFELLHPFTVRAEYEAVGKPPPSVSDVFDEALTNVSQRAEENVRSVVNAGKLVLVSIVVLGVVYVVWKSRHRR